MVQDIVDALTDFFGGIGSTILDFIISLIGNMINLIVFPIDTLIRTMFPDFSSMITNFNSAVDYFLTTPISFIMYHIPPMTKSILLFYITLLIGYYSIIFIYKGIILIPQLIRKVKFW